MKPIINFGLLAMLILTTTCCSQERVVYLQDFLVEGAAESDATPAIRAALEQCTAINATKLILPGGQLYLKPDMAVEKYQFISNNDESLKRIAFDLVYFKNLTIDGNGTELLFSGFVSPFNLEGCENICITNLSIDFTRTFNSEGVIVDKGKGWLELKFPADYVFDFPNGCLRFRDDKWRTYPYASLLEFDAMRREPAFHAHDYWLWNKGVVAKKQSNGNVRIYLDGIDGTIGNVMVFGAEARYNPAFTLRECSGVTIKDVNIYHCGGMGVIAQMSANTELNNVSVMPAPDKGRIISITADATHFVNCSGYIRMIDCLFENQKDDATNVHGLYMVVDKVIAPDKVLLAWHNSGQYGVDFIKKGMTLEMVNNRNMETYAHRTVKSVKRLNKVYTEVTFSEPIPEVTKPSDVVANDEVYPEVLIKGCRIQNNRARGLLLGSRASIIIEDNYFHSAGAAILIEGDGNYWYEQSGVKDVLIRNNVFENGNYGCKTWGAACIAVGTRIPEPTNCRYHSNIRVEGNTFRIFDPRIANIYCIDGFSFTKDNVIEFTDDYPYVYDEKRSFVVSDCDNVDIQSVEPVNK